MKTQMISIDEMKPCTPSFRSTEWSATLILLDGKFAAKLSTLGAPQYCSIAYFQLTSNEVVPCHHESIWGFPTRQLWLHIGIGARFTRAREFRSRFPGLIGKIRGMMQSPKLKSNRMGIFFHGCDKRWMVWSLLGFLWVTLRCVSWKSTDVFSHNGSQRVAKVRTLSYQGNLLRIYVESHMEVRDCFQVSLNQAWDCQVVLKNESTICIFSWCSELYPSTSAWSTMFVSVLFAFHLNNATIDWSSFWYS